jgi:hypothetical protein
MKISNSLECMSDLIGHVLHEGCTLSWNQAKTRGWKHGSTTFQKAQIRAIAFMAATQFSSLNELVSSTDTGKEDSEM